MKILVTGGAGYVGSMICSALIDYGHIPVILDTLVAGRDEFVKDKIFYQGDIGDGELVRKIIGEHSEIKHVIHCAEKAAIEQSVLNPFEYYYSNVVKSMNMFKWLHEEGVRKIVFCSSASLYEDVPGYMVTETSPVHPRSPFARSKYMMEMILKDFCSAYDMQCIALRLFNPIGADPQMRSGISTKNPTNIIRRLIIAAKEDSPFVIAGKDWGTRDGTCVRDYIHVWDLVVATVKAIENFEKVFQDERLADKNFAPMNIGSGIGVTVKEFVFAFENVTGEKIHIEYGKRRPGDIAGTFANISRARHLLEWEAKLPIEEAILDATRWDEKLATMGR